MLKSDRIIAVCGPTAVGKSALAIRLARRFRGEIISADSRQVYRGLDVGTGKVTKREMAGVPHHMIDVADPKKRFSVVEFQKRGREKIAAIFSRGHIPIICGGTGFYISALVDNIVFPDVPPNPKLRAALAKKSVTALFKMLKKLDPFRAATIDTHNKRRLIRAIEIARVLGSVPNPPHYSRNRKTLLIGITLPQEKLREKIHNRLSTRIRAGMIAEAKKLHREGLSWKRMEELGLEYRYLARFLKHEISKAEMIRQLEIKIWHYARRQMTWFRRDKRIEWFEPTDYKKIERAIKNFI